MDNQKPTGTSEEQTNGPPRAEEQTNDPPRAEEQTNGPPPAVITPTVPIQQRPQRRGVEVNLNKYLKARQVVDKSDQRRKPNPRRIRLSTPLGVMAECALDEQRKSNALLTEILLELRNQRN